MVGRSALRYNVSNIHSFQNFAMWNYDFLAREKSAENVWLKGCFELNSFIV